jgi:anti-sigma-K factor RskA
MDIRGNAPLRETLAAEYALGTLSCAARRRFERWMRNDAELRAIVVAWSERLVPLVDAIAPVAPPARVWRAIEARLTGFSARHGNAPIGWWDRVTLWRGLSSAFAAVAAIAVAVALRPVPPVVEIQTRAVEVETTPAAVATITDPKTAAPVAVVFASKSGRALVVKVSADVQVPEGQALQLWTTTNGKEMRSVAVWRPVVPGEQAHFDAVDAAQVGSAVAFGLSLEPAGGSPKPTHVLGLGALVRIAS